MNFLVQEEDDEIRPSKIFIYRTVIGWVIYGQCHCHREKKIQPVPAGNQTQDAGSTGKHYLGTVKVGFYHKAVEVYYIPRPCDTIIDSDFRVQYPSLVESYPLKGLYSLNELMRF